VGDAKYLAALGTEIDVSLSKNTTDFLHPDRLQLDGAVRTEGIHIVFLFHLHGDQLLYFTGGV
jgi:hypothetical protein